MGRVRFGPELIWHNDFCEDFRLVKKTLTRLEKEYENDSSIFTGMVRL